MGDIVVAESDVVMLTPVMVLNTVNIVVITPALTAILASDIDLNEPNCLDIESDMDMDSGMVL